ncbi:L,D-transpeptidase family protein [Pararhodobacter oceanensis]|uniref:L,D-transpeptidase family protein n=1 Tax=Pararhodobacter oceanensis TaxID=2172121 RepID=UPI003A94EB52
MTRDDLLLTPTGVLFQNRRLPCTLGRGGITCNKREGDGATPTGIHRITGLWFRPDRIAAHLLPPHARPITPRDLWCDAPDDPAYNQHVRAPFAASHEVLRRADPQYDLILTTDWNTPAAPQKGSAIFLHTWRRPGHPTAGCIAFSRADLLWIIARLTPRSRVIVRG